MVDPVAELLKVLGRYRGDFVAVLDQQHSSLFRPDPVIDRGRRLFDIDWRIGHRQVDAHGRAGFRLTAYRRSSPRLPGKSIHLAQTKASPLPHAFGGEERVEYARQRL